MLSDIFYELPALQQAIPMAAGMLTAYGVRAYSNRRPRPAIDPKAWCQGCGKTPNTSQMHWTETGLYRCRTCSGLPYKIPTATGRK